MAERVKIQSRKTVFRLIYRVLMSVVLQESRPARFRSLVVMGTIFVSEVGQLVTKSIRMYCKAILKRFPWDIAGPILQFLKPSVNCHSAKRFVRKCGTDSEKC